MAVMLPLSGKHLQRHHIVWKASDCESTPQILFSVLSTLTADQQGTTHYYHFSLSDTLYRITPQLLSFIHNYPAAARE